MKFVKELTKFDNLDAFDAGGYGGNFRPNKGFDGGSDTITVGSKMNDDDSDFMNNTNEEVPF